jgi:molybdopterin-guanine dinucleotide biosynthesis protein A
VVPVSLLQSTGWFSESALLNNQKNIDKTRRCGFYLFKIGEKMTKKLADMAAVILADGRNSRIQQEKSLLKFGNLYLIESQVEVLSSIFSQIYIATSKAVLQQKLPHIPKIQDQYLNCGPLGGIHTALLNSKADSVFVFACDMPNLNRKLIEFQIEEYQKITCDALIPRHREGIEPLHAIYAKACLFPIEYNLRRNLCSVRSFYEKINVNFLQIEKNKIKYFYNINTHQDFCRASSYLSSKKSYPV